MEHIVFELWLPDEPLLWLILVIMTIFMVARLIWRLIPIIGG